MKVVINKCYGGFGVSRDAVRELLKAGCPHVTKTDPKEYYGGRDGWERRFAEESNRTGLFSLLVVDGKVITDEHRSSDGRTCPLLVALIESKGSEWASMELGEIGIVEIPDGVEYEIDEYDGIEHVVESHRTWR